MALLDVVLRNKECKRVKDLGASNAQANEAFGASNPTLVALVLRVAVVAVDPGRTEGPVADMAHNGHLAAGGGLVRLAAAVLAKLAVCDKLGLLGRTEVSRHLESCIHCLSELDIQRAHEPLGLHDD